MNCNTNKTYTDR